MTEEELKQEAEEWLRSTDNHLNEEKTHFLSESEYAERAYLAGAEPREKRIQEKDKKIAELEHQLIHRNCLDCSNHSSKLRMRTLELEKENAELKAKNKWYADQVCNAECSEVWGNLTKAKEIIRSLYFVIQDRIDYKGNIPLEDEMYRAKQFLK